eukprot:Nk52_evm2s221 gene=Nk52_evmTU2s221
MPQANHSEGMFSSGGGGDGSYKLSAANTPDGLMSSMTTASLPPEFSSADEQFETGLRFIRQAHRQKISEKKSEINNLKQIVAERDARIHELENQLQLAESERLKTLNHAKKIAADASKLSAFKQAIISVFDENELSREASKRASSRFSTPAKGGGMMNMNMMGMGSAPTAASSSFYPSHTYSDHQGKRNTGSGVGNNPNDNNSTNDFFSPVGSQAPPLGMMDHSPVSDVPKVEGEEEEEEMEGDDDMVMYNARNGDGRRSRYPNQQQQQQVKQSHQKQQQQQQEEHGTIITTVTSTSSLPNVDDEIFGLNNDGHEVQQEEERRSGGGGRSQDGENVVTNNRIGRGGKGTNSGNNKTKPFEVRMRRSTSGGGSRAVLYSESGDGNGRVDVDDDVDDDGSSINDRRRMMNDKTADDIMVHMNSLGISRNDDERPVAEVSPGNKSTKSNVNRGSMKQAMGRMSTHGRDDEKGVEDEEEMDIVATTPERQTQTLHHHRHHLMAPSQTSTPAVAGASSSSSSSAAVAGTGPTSGKDFFKQARSRLSTEAYTQLVDVIKEQNLNRLKKDEAMRICKKLFGEQHSDLFMNLQEFMSGKRRLNS